MRTLIGSAERGPLVSSAVIVGSVAALALAVVTNSRPTIVAGLVLTAVVGAAGHRVLLRWETLLCGVILVIFFIPIKRYTLPSSLSFNLEPYRVLIALVAVAWVTSVLIDPRVRLRSSGLEPPLLLFVLAALSSVIANGDRIETLRLSSFVFKSLTFFASFIVLFYVIVSVVHVRSHLDRLVRILVGSGSVIAVASLVESRTNFNVFNHLGQFLPGLHFNDPRFTGGLDTTNLDRSGGLRAYASAAHPIELSAVLVMLVPLALYLLKVKGQKRWLASAVVLELGALATLSRTGVVMMIVVALVFLWLRPAQTRRTWPALVVALPVVYVALPHTLGTFYSSFFPKGGLVAEQSTQVRGNQAGADGRLTDVGPSLTEFSHRPILGEGFGSRVTSRTESTAVGIPRARLLDDQWLGSLLETGIVGAAALLWLFTRSIRRLARVARDDDGPDGWLAVALVAATYAFGVGMLTFDALGFVQVTILLFVLIALGSVLTNLRAAGQEPAEASTHPLNA